MRSSFYLECSGYGQNASTSRSTYPEPPVIDGTTEEILSLRRRVIHHNNTASRLARGPHHWSNIPSGAEYQRNFESKYPGMRSGPYDSDYDPSFPYQRLKPFPQKPASDLLLYSNTNTYSQSYLQSPCYGSNYYGNSSLIAQNRQNSSRSCRHSHLGGSEDRIRKALKHIDNASKILENY